MLNQNEQPITVKDIANIIEQYAPLELALDFDNCGLNIGSYDDIVNGVLVCVDVTPEVVQEALRNNCNMIISHHPVVWDKMRTITKNNYQGQIVMQAIASGINIYCSHTKSDIAVGGINDWLCSAIGINNIISQDSYYRIGTVKKTTLLQLQNVVAMALEDSNIKTIGDLEDICYNVAIGSGSCGRDDDLVDILIGKGVDTFITSEVKLSIARKCQMYGIKIIETGHFESEKCFCSVVSKWLESQNCWIKISDQKSPYNQKP